VALRQCVEATAGHLDERLEPAAAQVLTLVRHSDDERAADRGGRGQGALDVCWSADDIALLDQVARLTAVRSEARALNAGARQNGPPRTAPTF